MKLMRIGMDLAKNVFQIHGVDRHEKPMGGSVCRAIAGFNLCWRRSSRLVRSVWRVVVVRIIGRGNCRHMVFG